MADIKAAIYLKDGTKVEFGKRYIQNVESLSQSNADPSTIFYGVLASTGSIQILDINGQIESYIKNDLLDITSITVELYINNKLIHSHISNNNSYDNVERILNLQLSDKLTKWDNINFNGYDYPEKEQTAYEMLKNILIANGYTEDYIDNTMLSEYTLDSSNIPIKIKDYLNSIIIQYPYLPAGSLHETIDKFCTLAQLNVILDSDNNIKFINSRPVIQQTSSIINIPKSQQYSKLNYTLIRKNKYDAVEMNEVNVTNVIDYKAIIGSFNSSEDKYSVSRERDSNIRTGSVYNDNVYLEITYYSGSLKIPQISNNGLSKVIKVYSGLDNSKNSQIQNTVNYNLYTGIVNNSQYVISPPSVTTKNRSEGSGSITKDGQFKVSFNSASLTMQDKSNLSSLIPSVPTSEDKNYTIDFIVATGKDYRGYYTDQMAHVVRENDNKYEEYSPKNLEITIYGDIRKIQFENTPVSSDAISSAKNPVSIYTSELFEQVTTIDGEKISNIVKNNILSDYSIGISDATLTVSCANYYDEAGNRIIDFNKGELLNVGDIVQIEGSNKTWRITGRKFRYAGCPFVDLELMEVNKVKVKLKKYTMAVNNTKTTTIITRISSLDEEAKLGEISINEPIYAGDVIKFNVKTQTGLVDANIESLQISTDGSQFNDYRNNSEVTVNSNITLNAVAKSWVVLDSFSSISGLEHSLNEDTKFTYINDKIKVGQQLRISCGSIDFYNPNNYYPDVKAFNKQLIKGGRQHIEATEYEYGGTVTASLEIILYAPTENNKLEYINRTNNSSFYMRGWQNNVKFEQYI